MEFLLQHLLSNSAARYPEREAMRMNSAGISYKQLDRLSNQTSRLLLERGVRRGDRVAIYVPKSFASIICLYGILKAGAAYVPLDPNAPAKRLAYILRDCGVRVLLTSPAKLPGLAEILAEETPVQTVVLMEKESDQDVPLQEAVQVVTWNEVESQEDRTLDPAGTIDTDLAYILYTSGSTGAPKGVMIAHRTIFTFIDWCRNTFHLTCQDRVTSHAPLHFDLSTFDIFATTQAGGTMILIGEGVSTLPVRLIDLLQNERVTATYLVPSILSLAVNYGMISSHDLSPLRFVLFAGEVFPIKYLRRLVAAIPHAEFYNLYGPTETNVCTYYKVEPSDLLPERGDRPIPIGRSCENMEVFAVNEADELVTKPGEEGELWVRGPCVAQGYWGDQEKTARSFVQNPFQRIYPDMTYRTGDLVVLAEDQKNWIYKGRKDHMVKTRGYRVELGEIEKAFYQHEDVKEVAVVAIPDELVGNRIRAFVVMNEDSQASSSELHAFCAQLVPKYMLPERIEMRNTIPKTSSGKIDRIVLLAEGH